MRARDLELLLPTLSGHTAADLDLRFRELRKMRMLPTGGRGRHAPDITAEHVATILIAVAGSTKAIEAARAVLDFAPLREVEGGGETFAEALTTILNDEDLAGVVGAVRLCRTLNFAEIEYENGAPTRRFFNDEAIEKIKSIGTAGVLAYGTTTIVDQTVIGAGIIHQLAIDLADTDDAEWTADVPRGEG